MQWQAAVRPIKVDDECSGTAVRLKETGKFVSATHTVVENGRFLDAFIDGHPLKLIASFPREDIIFLEGMRLAHTHSCGHSCCLFPGLTPFR